MLPPELGQCAPFRIEEVSRYDERGPAWYWNNISLGEHTGTHFDAPIHWISGKDLPNNAVDTIDVAQVHRAGLRDRLLEGMRRQSGFRADHPVRRAVGGAPRQDRAGKLGAAAHRLVEADLSGLRRTARRRRAHAGARARRGEVVRRGARRARLRHRDDRHRFRPGPSFQSALSGAFLHARQGPLRPAVPDQSRSAAAQGRGHHRGAAEDQAGLGQPVARAGAGRGDGNDDAQQCRRRHRRLDRHRRGNLPADAGRRLRGHLARSPQAARSRMRSCMPSRSICIDRRRDRAGRRRYRRPLCRHAYRAQRRRDPAGAAARRQAGRSAGADATASRRRAHAGAGGLAGDEAESASAASC